LIIDVINDVAMMCLELMSTQSLILLDMNGPKYH